MKRNGVLLVFRLVKSSCSCRDLVGRDMGLAILWADAGAGPAAYAAAGMINDHDHAIELAIEVIILVVAGTKDYTRVINAVKMHDLARADLEAASAANAGLAIDRSQIFRHPSGAVACDEGDRHRERSQEASSVLAASNSAKISNVFSATALISVQLTGRSSARSCNDIFAFPARDCSLRTLFCRSSKFDIIPSNNRFHRARASSALGCEVIGSPAIFVSALANVQNASKPNRRVP
ncbi:conserved hypothetical protein [Mesorhizobium prunaredense]|uniref:Uncharacterized protein n=1 Tax=Mesorhizobium prunaredense TaxID=1631249 RepID=A0A1R3VB22_9HYPH|nr:conserved hypothetical protein [Mesorhizobium prunaredense]